MRELETILRLVAEGHLTPDEAASIIEALGSGPGTERPAADALAPARPGGGGRHVRIKVTEHGRQVVNLRIPVPFADMALRMVPGLSGDQADRIRGAIDAGSVGPIIDVEDPDGDGVLITME